MREGLRAEFPELAGVGARVRRPRIGPESLAWALVCGIGAAFIAGAVTTLVLQLVSPFLFPPTEPRPEWWNGGFITRVVSGVAAGAVLVRAGGLVALAGYAVYELVLLLAGLPGRIVFCERSAGDPNLAALVRGCDYPSLVVEHWPTWIALVAGALAARWTLSEGTGPNRMLRGAGVFALAMSFVSAAVGLASGMRGGTVDDALTLEALFGAAELVAGVLAGIVLARASLARSALVALAIAMSSIFTVRFAFQELPAGEPAEFALSRMLAAVIPIAGALAVLLARAYVRRRASRAID